VRQGSGARRSVYEKSRAEGRASSVGPQQSASGKWCLLRRVKKAADANAEVNCLGTAEYTTHGRTADWQGFEVDIIVWSYGPNYSCRECGCLAFVTLKAKDA